MGIYVPFLDLPKCCVDCWLVKCCPSHINKVDNQTLFRCQLTEVNKPHGRLIDADKIFTYDRLDELNIESVQTVIDSEV